MATNTDFGRVADDLRRAATAFALLTSSASAFGRSLQAFREFERQLILTNAIAQGTVTTFRQFEETARNAALVTTTTAVEAGVALQQLAQAGFTAQESLNAFAGVLLFSQATLTDVATSSDILTSSIRAFGLATTDATRITNIYSATITGSLATTDKLAFALRQVAPVARLAGLSVEETSAALGTLFNVGLRGEQAGTALRNIIIRLVRPLGEASDLLREAGIATRDATGEFRNLEAILRDISKSDLGDAELARIFETEALAGVKAFINALEDVGDDGVDAYTRLREAVTGTDRAIELAATNLSSFDAQIRLFQNSVSDVSKDVGKALAPTIETLLGFVRGLIESFRDLDPATQETVAAIAGFSSVAVGALAIVNALVLLLRGAGIFALAEFTAGLNIASISTTGFTTRLGATILTLTGFNKAVDFAIARLGLYSAAMTSTGTAAKALQAALVGISTVAGFAAIAGGVAALAIGLDRALTSANELDDTLQSIETAEFAIRRADTQEVLDNILGENIVEETRARVEQIRREISLLSLQSDPDALGFATRRAASVEDDTAGVIKGLREIQDRIGEEAFAFLEEREALERAIEADVTDSFLGELFVDKVVGGAQRRGLEGFFEGLNEEAQADIAAATDEYRALIQVLDEYELLVEDLENEQLIATRNIIENIKSGGETGFSDEFALAETLIRERGEELFSIPGRITEIARELSEENITDPRAILERLLERLEVDAEDTAGVLGIAQQKVTAALINGLTSLEGQTAADVEELRTKLLEQQLEFSEDLGEALDLSREIGFRELAADLEESAASLVEDAEKAIVDFGLSGRAGIDDVIREAFEGSGFSITEEDLPPDLAEILSAQPLVDGINKAIAEGKTDEQILDVAAQQGAQLQVALQAYLSILAEAGDITPEQANVIRQILANSIDRVNFAVQAGINDNALEAIDIRDRFEDAAGSGGDPEKEALRLARRLEDAFLKGAEVIRDAQTTFIEEAFGISPGARAEALGFLEVDEIIAEADDKIRDLNRKFEDLSLDFKGDSSKLTELRQQYDLAIQSIEAAKQAEIDAATSWEAQMDRRSNALQIFQRDLETAANTSGDAFDKVAAGIGIAFARYQDDLVSLVTITADAVEGLLDTLTTGISDFIFDSENAWESFKNNLLDISRQVFEGFTEALIQQGISSLTGGGGSLIGNILQPGAFGGEANTETPTVGTSGPLGGLFGGLLGGGQQGDNGAGQVAAGTQAVASALQQGAVQIQQALSQVGIQTQVGGTQVQAGLTRTGAGINAGGSQVATSLTTAGTQISTSANAAAARVASSGGGGGGGIPGGEGGGGFFKSVGNFFTDTLPSFFGFAEGGLVAGQRQMASMLRAYAEGGAVQGPGTGTSDSILARLSNGEFVVKADATRQFLPLLEAINSGNLNGDLAQQVLAATQLSSTRGATSSFPAFAGGGLVGGSGPTAFDASSISVPRPVFIESGRNAAGGNNSVVNNQRGGDTVVNLTVTYNISGPGGADNMRRSASQHAKQLASGIEKAKRNS